MPLTTLRFGSDVDPALDAPGRKLLAFWRENGTQEHPPARTLFDPTDHPKALPGIQIVEWVGPPDDFRYRLAGTREVENRGLDPTGKPVRDAFFGGSAEAVIEKYQRAITDRQPMISEDAFRTARGVPTLDVSLFLPLADADDALRFILVYSHQRTLPRDHPLWTMP